MLRAKGDALVWIFLNKEQKALPIRACTSYQVVQPSQRPVRAIHVLILLK
jgi:hypothetical protein